jgi:hypothetical protein
VTDPHSYRPTAGRLTLTVVKPAGKALFGVLITVLVLGAGLFLTIVAAFAGKNGVSPELVATQLVLALVLLVTAFLLLLWVLRNRAWLEGTTLVVRTSYSTRRCDLAADPVGLGRLLWAKCLVGRDRVTSRPARLGLDTLTAPELAAVADAITAGGRRDPDAWQAADELRRRAAQRQRAAGWRPAVPPGPAGPPR